MDNGLNPRNIEVQNSKFSTVQIIVQSIYDEINALFYLDIPLRYRRQLNSR